MATPIVIIGVLMVFANRRATNALSALPDKTNDDSAGVSQQPGAESAMSADHEGNDDPAASADRPGSDPTSPANGGDEVGDR